MPLNDLPLPCFRNDPEISNRISLNDDWYFRRFEEVAEEPESLQAVTMDASWQEVTLPHDWGIAGPFREDLPNNTGKLPWHGIGWYRKSFEIPEMETGERVLVEFEGAMSNPVVWLNGKRIGEWAYGYNSFILDATEAALPGQTNHLAVRLDNPLQSSRWYPGAGLYRDVWLLRKAPVSVDEWSTFITTPKISTDVATIDIASTVRNAGPEVVDAEVKHTILDPDGERLASTCIACDSLRTGEARDVKTLLQITRPLLWSPQSPVLYICRTEVRVGGTFLESKDTLFGIRFIEWKADDGFHLNGKRLQLKGVCQHHDLGALGGAFNKRAAERQLEILLEMGCNAIRLAHNPPAPALLDLCDHMGLLVVNELFDIWGISKDKDDYSRYFNEWHERDVRNWVCRDRNHPSIIAWSLGNEIREQEDHPGNHDRAKRLVELTHQYDSTRATTVGMNDGDSIINGFARIFDVAGYNYKAVGDKPLNYQTHMEKNPHQPVMGAETSSCLSSRGVYFFPVSREKTGGFFKYQVSSYDLYSPSWGYTPDVEFDSLDRFPAVAGEFVWSGFDYLGEPTPYNADKTNALNFTDPEAQARALAEFERLGVNAPSRSSYFGIIDLAGFPKDRYYLYQSRWRPDLPVAHILPHWNWVGREGEITPVHVYTNGDEAELFLNGESLGRKQRQAGEYRFVWEDISYQPGKLEVLTYCKGVPWANAVRETSGAPHRLGTRIDRTRIHSDGRDLAFVTVEVLDETGRIVPDACPELTFFIEGPARFVAADNGDPTDWTPFEQPSRRAFNGLALAILQGLKETDGQVTVEVTSPGIESTRLCLEVY